MIEEKRESKFQPTFKKEENRKMKKEKVQIKCRSKLLGIEKEIVRDYEFPENIQEAIKIDGDGEVFKTYAVKRKSDFMDDHRRKEVENMEKKAKAAMNDPEIAAKIRAILGA
jgi:hypothetical protein